MSDPDTKFSKAIGWTMGERTGRYALIIDHGKITYAEKETSGGEVTVGEVAQPIHRHADNDIGFRSRCCSRKALNNLGGNSMSLMYYREGRMCKRRSGD